MVLKGIDVSHHQGAIDWAQVKADGSVNFAFIRVGWAGYDGKIQANGGLDKQFHRNMQEAAKQGIPLGVYVYSYCKTPDAARIAAQEVLQLVSPYKLDYPIAFDIEDNMYRNMSKVENAAIVQAFLSEIERAKYYGMLYTYSNFADNFLSMSEFSQYDLWIADYRSAVGYKGKYGIWQYSCTGKINGINGDVDLNIAYKDYPNIIAKAGLNRADSQPPVNSAPDLADQLARVIKERDAALAEAAAQKKRAEIAEMKIAAAKSALA